MIAPAVHASCVAALTPVAASARRCFLDLPGTRAAHDEAFAAVPAFREVEVGGGGVAAAGDGLRVAAWNLERCLYPEAAAALLRRAGANLLLLSEMDVGCQRTGQRHTIGELAGLLGYRYGFALEFLELRAMRMPNQGADSGAGNRLGFHGNGFATGLPFTDPVVIRLDEVADWFRSPKGGEKRIGTRIAVAATFDVGKRQVVACSVHLESAADAAGRALQMRTLLDALDGYARDRPVVIGGDLNVHVRAGRHDDPGEPLFAETAARGYDWRHCNAAMPTTRPSQWSAGAGACQLDWFCTRGLIAETPLTIPALGDDGTVLSDHDLITVVLTPV